MTTTNLYRLHFFYTKDSSNIMATTDQHATGFILTNVPSKYYYSTVTIFEDETTTVTPPAPVPASGTVSVGYPSERILSWKEDVYHA